MSADKGSTPSTPAAKLPPKTKGILLCACVLALGLLGMKILIKQKKTPPKAVPQPPSLSVSLQEIAFTNVVTELEGFGVVKALRYTELSPEVGGRILAMPRDLRVGDQVKDGEPLFELDSRDYAATLDETEAQLKRMQAALEQLTVQEDSAKKRAGLLKRNLALSRKEFERQQRLFQEEDIGSQAEVERAEQLANQAEDRLQLLEESLALFPARRSELQAQHAAATAAATRARLNLERCELRAPFAGRITFVALEANQQLRPGQHVLTLADDRVLEIQAAIDSADLRKWLRLQAPEKQTDGAQWLPPVEPVEVEIRWTESTDTLAWRGRLHRLVSFDPRTRSATVAVRIRAEEAAGDFPLIDGMFCELTIPGRELSHVAVVPSAAVSYDSKVYLSVSNQLQTVPVEVLRTQGDWAIIGEGLDEGDLLVTTRLVAPLEGIALNPIKAD